MHESRIQRDGRLRLRNIARRTRPRYRGRRNSIGSGKRPKPKDDDRGDYKVRRGTRSASRLLDAPSVNAASTTYRRNKQQEVRTRSTATTKPRPDLKPEHTFDPNALCRFCAEKRHGKNAPWGVRRTQCPAFGKRCGKCKVVNHIERACLGKAYARRPTETAERSDEQSGAFELCTMVNGRLLT